MPANEKKFPLSASVWVTPDAARDNCQLLMVNGQLLMVNCHWSIYGLKNPTQNSIQSRRKHLSKC